MTDPTLIERLSFAASYDEPDHGLRFLDGSRGERFLSFREVLERARRAAGALRKAGIAPGDRVPIIIPTGPEFLDAFFGTMALGAIPVPLYPPVRLGRLEEYYERTAAMAAAVKGTAIIAPTAVRSLLGQVVARYRPKHGVIASETLAAGPSIDLHVARSGDLALIQFSSGTTVDPKPVGLTRTHIMANLDSFLGVMAPYEPPHPIGVSWLPLYHDLGLIGFLLGAVCRPGPLVLMPPEQFLARPHLWLQAISRFKAIISAAPNFAYAYCVERITDAHMEGCDLSSWQFALNGAEQVSASVLRSFTEKFSRWGLKPTTLLPVYGLAEATVGVSITPLGKPWQSVHLDRPALVTGQAVDGTDLEIVSVGRPLAHIKIEIRQNGAPVGERCVGRVWVQGPSVPPGYVDRNDSPVHDGWLDTGDLGFLLDGELYITGHARDVVILRGENHSPHEIERVVDRVAGIRTGCVAAVGMAGENGERLIVLAEVREGRPELEDECRRAVLSAIGVAAEIRLLDPGALPRTSSGKIRRQEALRRYESGTLDLPARVTPLLMGRAWLDNLKGYRKL